ncbi:MAG: cytochrome c [Bacteroidota bacterium]
MHNLTHYFSRYILLTLVGFTLLLSSCYYDNEEDLYPVVGTDPVCDTTDVSYAATVLPILEENCIGCHSGANPSGNVGLDSYDKVVASANSGNLYGSIAHLDGFSKMPKGGDKIPDCDIEQIKSWIDAGTANN